MQKDHRKIAIYLYDIRNRNVGIGEFSYQLASAISQRAKELKSKYGLSFTFIVPYDFPESEFGNDVSYIKFSPIGRILLKHFSHRFDLYHATHQGARLKNMHNAAVNLMTVHDINFMYEKHGLKQLKYSIKFKKRLKRVSHLTYISNFARNDVESIFSPHHPSEVIYNGVKNLTDVHCDTSTLDLPPHFLFHISSLMPKKNVHLLVEMMQFLPNENLVIAGNIHSAYAKGLKDRINELGLSNITLVGSVSNEQKAELYRKSKAFLFPSLCEGFGLPPIEAMFFGKPVFLSTLTSLPEIGGDESFYFNELEPEKMAEDIEKGLSEFYSDKNINERQMKTHAENFSWEKSVNSYINLYLQLLDKEK